MVLCHFRLPMHQRRVGLLVSPVCSAIKDNAINSIV